MTINSTQKQILKLLWNSMQENSNKILLEDNTIEHNKDIKKQAQRILTVIRRLKKQYVDFESMDIIEDDDGEILALFKEWDILITDVTNIESELLTNIILPYISYNIIYEEAQENNIDFYNDQLDLQETHFYELQNNSLILHISTFIRKNFESGELFIPQVKLLINFNNPLTIMA